MQHSPRCERMQRETQIHKVGSLDTFAAPDTSGCFGKSRRSLRGARTGKMRTNPPFAGAATADAAFPRMCSSLHFAAQRISPNWPFYGGKTRRIQTFHSMRRGSTFKLRALQPMARRQLKFAVSEQMYCSTGFRGVANFVANWRWCRGVNRRQKHSSQTRLRNPEPVKRCLSAAYQNGYDTRLHRRCEALRRLPRSKL